MGQTLSLGAIGLYLSHAEAWPRLVDEGLEYGIIFEDDLRFFAPSFKTILQQLAPQDSPSLDRAYNGSLIYLQHCSCDSETPCWPRGCSSAPAYPYPKIKDVASNVVVPCTAAYVLSKGAARQLLQRAFPISEQLDRAFLNNVVMGLHRQLFEPAVAQVGAVWLSSDVQDVGIHEGDPEGYENESELCDLSPNKYAPYRGAYSDYASYSRRRSYSDYAYQRRRGSYGEYAYYRRRRGSYSDYAYYLRRRSYSDYAYHRRRSSYSGYAYYRRRRSHSDYASYRRRRSDDEATTKLESVVQRLDEATTRLESVVTLYRD